MERAFSTFVGVDLGGARGKTTAVATLARRGSHAMVDEVATRRLGMPWHDETLWDYLSQLGPQAVIAINAPLTAPACVRCQLDTCPGVASCVDPAVVWLRSEGRELVQGTEAAIARGGSTRVFPIRTGPGRAGGNGRVVPYAHRATELILCHERGLLPETAIGAATGPVAARARHLVRRLAGAGFTLGERLLEVSAQATVAGLFDRRRARGYKRDADPWHTRASIVEGLPDLGFAPASRLAREEVLRNDHCFDALLAGYSAYRWAVDGWPGPPDDLAVDGWIWAPPPP